MTDILGISDIYAGDYYEILSRLPMPVKWMSAENLSHSVFTTSVMFGVTVSSSGKYFFYGNSPYFGLSNYQAM